MTFSLPSESQAKVQLWFCRLALKTWDFGRAKATSAQGFIIHNIFFFEPRYWPVNVTSQWVLFFKFYVYVGLQATDLLAVNKYLAELRLVSSQAKDLFV